MNYWIIYSLIFCGGIAVFVAPFFLFRRHGKKPGRVQTLIENVSLSLLVFFLIFMGLELYFYFFVAQPDGFRYTLASQNWYNRYWQENSLGFRDLEWQPAQLVGKTKVMVVGDSFVAGSGIANPEDRFSNQLGRLLGQDYVVFNVGSPGWDTGDEVQAVTQYPYRPDLIILSYYINDIESTAYDSGLQRPQIRRDLPAWLSPLVQNSYVINFLYWRVIRLGPQEWADSYWNWLRQISNDPNIRWRHQQELLTLINGAASEQIPLMVVAFPNLAAMEESRPILQPVLDLFKEYGVPVLDIGVMLAGRKPAEITVNAVDSHPNEAVHLEVAEHLYQMIQAHSE